MNLYSILFVIGAALIGSVFITMGMVAGYYSMFGANILGAAYGGLLGAGLAYYDYKVKLGAK